MILCFSIRVTFCLQNARVTSVSKSSNEMLSQDEDVVGSGSSRWQSSSGKLYTPKSARLSAPSRLSSREDRDAVVGK